jgi:hypothetical protein
MLALLTFVITAAQFLISRRWVYYEDGAAVERSREKGARRGRAAR